MFLRDQKCRLCAMIRMTSPLQPEVPTLILMHSPATMKVRMAKVRRSALEICFEAGLLLVPCQLAAYIQCLSSSMHLRLGSSLKSVDGRTSVMHLHQERA